MESWINPWSIIFVITGLLTLIFGYTLLKFPPKKINWFYGYRTARSMKSQQRWDFAQTYSGREMVRGGVLMIVVGVCGAWLPLEPVVVAFLSIPVVLLLAVVLIYRVEQALIRKFGK